ncbi:hypothetical protein ASN18_1955 [Candidatus Magnetominusculus xianensis]|uniref:Secreted protein n=1 Tax=Candidatus Magnetominusculus xianensis TaxID=1748249 RepID=A0ABR5SEE4_9BACT|nr:hypothetical protein ASN18_1955 [Candidatus Magnetominusculus xianensis]MBF0405433.1 hypothetical protein [Nitrospirota bacterium]
MTTKQLLLVVVCLLVIPLAVEAFPPPLGGPLPAPAPVIMPPPPVPGAYPGAYPVAYNVPGPVVVLPPVPVAFDVPVLYAPPPPPPPYWDAFFWPLPPPAYWVSLDRPHHRHHPYRW